MKSLNFDPGGEGRAVKQFGVMSNLSPVRILETAGKPMNCFGKGQNPRFAGPIAQGNPLLTPCKRYGLAPAQIFLRDKI